MNNMIEQQTEDAFSMSQDHIRPVRVMNEWIQRKALGKHLRVALLFQTPTTLKASKRAEMPLKLVHIGNHIRYARYLRKLTPGEAGKQIGVGIRTLLDWEKGVRTPEGKSLPAVLGFLGYDPYPPPQTTLGERLFALRRAWGWSHEEAANAFGVAAKTWWTWEVGEHSPLPLHRKLLETFVESSYAEATKDWQGVTPPSGEIIAPACFKVVKGRIVNTEGTITAARIRWARERGNMTT